MTCADAQRVASCVSEGEALKDMKKVGSHGKQLGNVTRDFLRMAKSNLKCELPELFVATVEVFDNKGGVAEEKISMLLPHEMFAWLGTEEPKQFDRVLLNGGLDHVKDWFNERKSMPWYEGLIRQRLECCDAPAPLVPVMIYGDDAELQSGRSALMLTWSSPMSNDLPIREKKIPIAIVPNHLCTKNTLAQVYNIVVWSLEAMWNGEWPKTGPDGQPLTGWRGRKGGWWLVDRGDAPESLASAVLVEYVGDWKWIKEAFGVKAYYACNRLCHLCLSMKKPIHGRPRFDDFSVYPSWVQTLLDTIAFLELCNDAELAQSPGFHVSMSIPDIMHLLHLGVLGNIVAATLLELCLRGTFGVFEGKFLEKLTLALRVAYRRFRNFAIANNYAHSQPVFNNYHIGVNKTMAVPTWHGKAHNCKIVFEWLHSEIESVGLEIEKHLFKNMKVVLDLLHTHNRNKAVDVHNRATFLLAGLEVLGVCKQFSQRAGVQGKRWTLKPKHHMLHHVFYNIAKTGIIPNWSFADETMNSLLKKTEMVKGNFRTASRRILSKWLLSFGMMVDSEYPDDTDILDINEILMRDPSEGE